MWATTASLQAWYIWIATIILVVCNKCTDIYLNASCIYMFQSSALLTPCIYFLSLYNSILKLAWLGAASQCEYISVYQFWVSDRCSLALLMPSVFWGYTVTHYGLLFTATTVYVRTWDLSLQYSSFCSVDNAFICQ